MNTELLSNIMCSSKYIPIAHWLWLLLFTDLSINIVKSQNIYNGPATIDYFQQDLTSTTNLPKLACRDPSTALDGLFDINMTDGLNNYFGETDSSNPVRYYRLSITSQIKQSYTSLLSVSTCCDLHICQQILPNDAECQRDTLQNSHDVYSWLYGQSDANYTYDNATFCSMNDSLDTYLYILQEKKGQVNLIETVDDSSSCTNSQKSTVDLMNYPEGEYIVAVGGYAQEYGSYYLHLSCFQYSYPMKEEEFKLPDNVSTISCNSALNDETTNEKLVSYYLFNITKTTYLPIIINVYLHNSEGSNVHPPIFKVFKKDSNNYEMVGESYKYTNGSIIGNRHVAEDNNIFSIGIYYVAVQGMLNQPANFSLIMECSLPPTPPPTAKPSASPIASPTMSPTSSPITPPKLDHDIMQAIVFGTGGFVFLLFAMYYIYQWIKHWRDRLTPIDQNDDDEKDEDEDKQKRKKIIGGTMSIRGVSVRRLDLDKNIEDQLDENQDIIQLVLAHTIKCCEDQNGFDIFQVLAIRYYEKNSGMVQGRRPFIKIGIDTELMKLSPFVHTVFVAFIVAATQTWGITVVVYKLIYAYFGDGFDDIVCDMDYERWVEVFSLKILSFLLSLVITFCIGIFMKGIEHNGLYEIMYRLSPQHIKRIDKIALWIIQIGRAINYYVCLIAIIGSYFIIFDSNKGEEDIDASIDYSHSGLDMILNAVALFFMLELDDMMVTEQDYVDCGQHLKLILSNYHPDERINTQYIIMQSSVDEESDDDIDDERRGNNRSRSQSVTEQTYNKCEACIIPFMYHFINVFSIFVTIFCYGGGIIAPFLIFFCW